MIVQGELFPTEVTLRPTIAMQRGDSFVVQCSYCGLLVCAARKVALGDCPACPGNRPADYEHSWWRQDLPVGPFRPELVARDEVAA
ncbi:MAG: hypothetical protein ABL993_02405 [Vicinamibacterales bacterium]